MRNATYEDGSPSREWEMDDDQTHHCPNCEALAKEVAELERVINATRLMASEKM